MALTHMHVNVCQATKEKIVKISLILARITTVQTVPRVWVNLTITHVYVHWATLMIHVQRLLITVRAILVKTTVHALVWLAVLIVNALLGLREDSVR